MRRIRGREGGRLWSQGFAKVVAIDLIGPEPPPISPKLENGAMGKGLEAEPWTRPERRALNDGGSMPSSADGTALPRDRARGRKVSDPKRAD